MSTIFIRKTSLVLRVHYGGLNPLDTKASKKQGGRWNRKNKYGVIYTALDKKTLRAELYKMVDKRGITAKDLFHWKITVIEVKLKNVLDLTDPKIRKKFGIELSDKLEEIQDFREGNVLIVVGGVKVPGQIFELADFNIAIGNQPHSEVAALAVFLDRITEGKARKQKFQDANYEIVPMEKGKQAKKI